LENVKDQQLEGTGCLVADMHGAICKKLQEDIRRALQASSAWYLRAHALLLNTYHAHTLSVLSMY
jgi:hypothetical protein